MTFNTVKFFLFSKFKMALKGRIFNDVTIIQQNNRMHMPSFEQCTL